MPAPQETLCQAEGRYSGKVQSVQAGCPLCGAVPHPEHDGLNSDLCKQSMATAKELSRQGHGQLLSAYKQGEAARGSGRAA